MTDGAGPHQAEDRPILAPHDFPVHRRVTTRWADNDVYGHVNNAVYYEFFDTAVNAWLIEASGTEIPGTAIGIVAETSCRYLREISFPDELSIGIALEREGNSSVTYGLGVFVARRGEIEPAASAAGRFVHVYVDQATRRPVPIPERVRQALRRLRS